MERWSNTANTPLCLSVSLSLLHFRLGSVPFLSAFPQTFFLRLIIVAAILPLPGSARRRSLKPGLVS